MPALFDPGGAFGDNPLALPAAPLTGPAGTSLASALALTCGAPTFDFAPGSRAVLEAGATELLCIPVTMTERITGAALPVDMTTLFAGSAVRIAVSRVNPAAGDFQPALLLVAGGTVYACLLMGAGGYTPPFFGYGRVFVRVTSGNQALTARSSALVLLRTTLASTVFDTGTAPPAPSLLTILAAQSTAIADLRSQLMAFLNNAPSGTEPIVAVTATVTLTLPAVNTVYKVAPVSNTILTLPATTGSGRRLFFDLGTLGAFTFALALSGSDAYQGGATPASLYTSGSSFAVRDLAAGVWAIE